MYDKMGANQGSPDKFLRDPTINTLNSGAVSSYSNINTLPSH